MNIPNLLTVARFIIIPIFGYYLMEEEYMVAAFLFLLSGLTDVLDGFIARRFDMVTAWGKLADPLADKLTQITALVLLTIQEKIPIFILGIVVVKEVFMGAGSVFLYKKQKFVVSANWYGKMATVIFYLAVIMIILFHFNKLYNFLFIGVAVASTLFAFVMYIRSFAQIRKRAK